MSDNNSKYTRAVTVGIIKDNSMADECRRSLDELDRLIDTAGGECVSQMIQIKSSYDPATCIGSGKVEELARICVDNDAKLVVFDNELSPSQIRNLEDKIGNDVSVIDRSMLILDIFALHAGSGEGKLQVELAQLKYTAPRLIGKGEELSRQEGRIGTRGPGESKLESDRRHLKRRIVSLEKDLAEMEKNRKTMRAARDRSGIVKVAIVGYTNAGKSTLLNCLTNAGVLAQDKLFATLDPTTRRLDLPDAESVLLTDTVGFIRNLPHHLVKAFRSTLDEAVYSDIILVVADATDPCVEDELAVTHEILESLGAVGKPTLTVYNKCDMLDENINGVNEKNIKDKNEKREEKSDVVFISAKTGKNIDILLSKLSYIVKRQKRKVTMLFPYDSQSELNRLYASATVSEVDYLDEGVKVVAVLDSKCLKQFEKFIKNDDILSGRTENTLKDAESDEDATR